MISIQKLFFIIMTTLAFTACHKENVREDEYLIFGHFYGFCSGEMCIETFQIKDQMLFEDTKDQYRSLTEFNFIGLPQSKYELVKNITDQIPANLWNEENEKVFGCPDCYDQGGYLIQLHRNGMTKSWILDKNPKDVPDYLNGFMDNIDEAIKLIHQ